jgi:hypothetical protein
LIKTTAPIKGFINVRLFTQPRAGANAKDAFGFMQGVRLWLLSGVMWRSFWSLDSISFMNIRASILLLAGCCSFLAGCQRQAVVSNDSFRLTVQHVITDSDVVVSLLKIRVPHDASISINGDGFHSMVTLPDSPAGAVRDGQIALSASRITRQGDNFAYIQTLIRLESPNGFAGGPAVHPVPTATRLESYFAVSAADGDYKIDAPLEIARLDDKPVTLVVGKPTK